MASYNYVSKEGYTRLRKQLDELKSTERQNIAKAIAEAREKGDLSENAEYHAAKEAQGMLELKISELEKEMSNLRILDQSQLDTSKVSILTNVRIKNTKNGKEMEYKIVSESEANLKEKKISASSPIGAGLMGKKPGEIAEVKTPAGLMSFEILEISK